MWFLLKIKISKNFTLSCTLSSILYSILFYVIILQNQTEILIKKVMFCSVIKDSHEWKEESDGRRKRLGQHRQIAETTMPVCDVYIYRPHVLFVACLSALYIRDASLHLKLNQTLLSSTDLYGDRHTSGDLHSLEVWRNGRFIKA